MVMTSAPNDPSSLQKNAAPIPATNSPELSVATIRSRLDGLQGTDRSTTEKQSRREESSIWKKYQAWNTQDLPLRVVGDAVAAVASGGLVAPLITIIDRYEPFC